MLRKLIKYEFKATGRILLPLYGALIITAIINRLFIGFNSDSRALGKLHIQLLMLLYVALIVGIGIMTFIIIIQRFNNNLLKDEGYLMHTLPVTTGQNIWCKAISSIIWVIGSGLVAFISMLLLLVNKDVISSIISNFDIVVEMFKKLNSEVGIHLYIIPFEIIVIMLLSTLVFIFTLYASISIGHLFPRHRILGSFGGFILINMLGNIAVSILGGWAKSINIISIESPIIVELSILIAILIEIIGVIILFFICKYILDRKLNLE